MKKRYDEKIIERYNAGEIGLFKGKVKWFNDQKGFGFIRTEEPKDYFVHYSAIISPDQRRSLKENDLVEFNVVEGDKGPKAVAVKKI